MASPLAEEDRGAALRALQDAAYDAGAEAQREAIAAHFEAEARRAARKSDVGYRRAAGMLAEIAVEVRGVPLAEPR